MDKDRPTTSIFSTHEEIPMAHLTCRPVTFLLTGFGWLVVSSIVGLAILIGMVHGTPLPQWLRLAHVHGALVGGVAQMILGGFLAFIPPLLMTGQKQRDSYPVLFVAINLGAIGMIAGFYLRNHPIVGIAGLLVVASFLWIARDAWAQTRKSLNRIPLNLWFYAISLLALFAGLAVGETMAFRLAQESYGHARLAHIHLNILGFVTLAIVGTMHNLLPTVLNAPLYSPRLARVVFILLPLGVAVLIGGFLNSSVRIEIAAGVILFAGASVYAVNMFRTWLASGHTGNAASDHLLIGTFFLLLTIALGMLVGANSLSDPPYMPYGSLHLVAYTHMALVGFILQTIFGALSHLVPITLAVSRVESNKKRGPYLEQLTTMIDRWRGVQIIGLSFGPMGLAVVALLTWVTPLNAPSVQIATWITVGLLLCGLALFSAKLAWVVGLRPSE
jgi:Cytochrome C and Quinol oxidase polypeptide I